ncbi:MAG: dienelactone hydrolase family protein [Mariniphaga sp.]
MRFIALITLLSFAVSLTAKTPVGNSPLIKEKSKTYPYLAYLPNGYDKSDTKVWPLIIYLHGSSCKGNNLERLKKYGPPFYLDRGMDVDAIVISPQCPSNKNWTAGTWFESFYQELKVKYNIDPSRVYLTGMSLGGFGTWDLASRYPEYFAAIMPLCGGGQTRMVETIKDIPTWVFHGEVDRKVNLRRSQEMVGALQDLGSRPKFSVLKGQGHGIQKVYSDQNIYKWLLSQHKQAYERFLEITSLWTPKVDSVGTVKQEMEKKDLVLKSSVTQSPVSQDNKTGVKSFFENLFGKKQTYQQSTLY